MAVVIDCPLGRDHRPRASHDGGFFHMKARERDRGGQRWYQSPMETSMSLDLLTQYIDHALTFERMADAEPDQGFRADLERQASAYRRLAAQRARRLGLPLPSEPERHSTRGSRHHI